MSVTTSDGNAADSSTAVKEFSFPSPILPPSKPWYHVIGREVVIFMLGAFFIPVHFYLQIIRYKQTNDVISKGLKKSIKGEPYYQDKDMLKNIWTKSIGKLYYNAVEYQKMEGYCASCTRRVILKSIPSILETDMIPIQNFAPSIPFKFIEVLDSTAGGCKIKSTIIYGSDGFEAFVCAIKKVNNLQYRVSVNFLRSALFGFNSYLPAGFFQGFVGGHFSNIIGYDDNTKLVCIFDVNHMFGCYLVDLHRLYDAVNTYDFSSGKTRAIIVTMIV